MTIVCGTDFSEHAEQAGRAAAAVAKRLGVPLKLVHVLPESPLLLSLVPSEANLRTALNAQAAKLHLHFGVDVEPIALFGVPHEALLEFALAANASLVVLSSLGMKKQQHWLVGSVAERVAQRSSLPVLVVRNAAGIEAWARAERALSVMLGADLGATSMGALRWVEGLRRVLPCDVCIAQVAWPFAEHARLGIKGAVALEGLRPELQARLEADLKTWAGTLQGEGNTTFLVSACWGRVDGHLAQLADEAHVDLLVVGTHQRAWAARAWQGSVSRGVLHYASSNVACVPPPRAREDDSALLPLDVAANARDLVD
ncbi:MAG TPA: universal stress protein [Polyangiaceae bacterium]